MLILPLFFLNTCLEPKETQKQMGELSIGLPTKLDAQNRLLNALNTDRFGYKIGEP